MTSNNNYNLDADKLSFSQFALPYRFEKRRFRVRNLDYKNSILEIMINALENNQDTVNPSVDDDSTCL
jgi:hypothetical protein